MWLAGRTAEIVAYNACDALATHLLMLCVGLHTGHLTPAHYARELDAAAALVWQQISRGQEHFRKFWTAWQGEAAAPKLATSTARREQLQSRWPECVAADATWAQAVRSAKARVGFLQVGLDQRRIPQKII